MIKIKRPSGLVFVWPDDYVSEFIESGTDSKTGRMQFSYVIPRAAKGDGERLCRAEVGPEGCPITRADHDPVFLFLRDYPYLPFKMDSISNMRSLITVLAEVAVLDYRQILSKRLYVVKDIFRQATDMLDLEQYIRTITLLQAQVVELKARLADSSVQSGRVTGNLAIIEGEIVQTMNALPAPIAKRKRGRPRKHPK